MTSNNLTDEEVKELLLRERQRLDTNFLKRTLRPLCERYGYGAVMQVVSHMWREKDPVGAIALGECYGTIEKESGK